MTLSDNTADDKKVPTGLPNDAVGEFGGWSFAGPPADPVDQKKEDGAKHLAAGLTATGIAAMMLY